MGAGPYEVVFAPEARTQLLALYRTIAAQAGRDRARALTNAILAYCESFETFPERGTRREDLRPGLRIIGFRRRVTIAFAIMTTRVTILGIFYGGQDFATSFSDDDEA